MYPAGLGEGHRNIVTEQEIKLAIPLIPDQVYNHELPLLPGIQSVPASARDFLHHKSVNKFGSEPQKDLCAHVRNCDHQNTYLGTNNHQKN